MLHGNGVRILRRLGISYDVEQAGTTLHRWSFCDEQGELLCEIDLPALWGEVGPTIGIARSELQQVLRAGAAEVPCRLGLALTSLARDEQCVHVGFSDGSSGDYDLVVGADGLASTVRRLSLEQARPGYTGLMVWRSLAPHQQASMQVLLGEGCVFGLVPVGEGLTYGFGIEGSPRFHRVGGSGAVAPRPRGAHRRCRTRRPTHDGPGRLYGHGGRLGAGRGPEPRRERRERPGPLRKTATTAR
jgi:2-polyprenyl-6-methoxyphenol hydroxylase-like FAD-dependent oxidoreductase